MRLFFEAPPGDSVVSGSSQKRAVRSARMPGSRQPRFALFEAEVVLNLGSVRLRALRLMGDLVCVHNH